MNVTAQCTRLLSSCKDLKPLLQIHGRLVVSGLLNTPQDPSVFLHNTVMRGYTRARQHKEAIKMYHLMLRDGLKPDRFTFTFVLKACTAASDLQEGVLVHTEIAERGLECDVHIGTSLVDMYSKFGDLRSAKQVFDKMPVKDSVAWNAIIAGLSQSFNPYEALEFFRIMQFCGVEPDSVSLLNVMPAVSKLVDIVACKSIHCYVVRRDFRSISVCNALIDMCCKCGDVSVARLTFDQMCGDETSWETMMAGYAHNGCFIEVLELFDSIKINNVKMSQVSMLSAISAATETRDLEKGKEIHNCAIQQGVESNIVVATPLVTMYAKCGDAGKAKQLFWGLKERDLISWSAIIAAFVQSGYHEEALTLFRAMLNENQRPNNVTLLSILRVCSELSLLRLGQSVHCFSMKNITTSDLSMETTLVSMYGKCGFFSPAITAFNRMSCKDVVTWNALINAFSQFGDPHCALEMFQKLQANGTRPDARTMVNVLPACAILNDLDQGSCIHGLVVKYGFESDSHVYITLIDMYAKCGNLLLAELLFSRATSKDQVTWNVRISAYMQNGRPREAISAFHQMKMDDILPNLVTVVSVLPAVAYLAALREGMIIHAFTLHIGFHSSTLVGNSLIDMYAKCGKPEYSEKLFNEILYKDTVSWNAMIMAYALHGQGHQAIKHFSLMQERSYRADSVSFLCVLSACRHAGLIDEGRKLFNSMREMHHLEPDLEHYACMVDLLGNAGLFDEALSLIKEMPSKPDAGAWGALLNACKMHSRVQLAEVAFNNLVELEPYNPTHFLVLSSIYAQSGRWVNAANPRLKIKESGFKKRPGCSWFEVTGEP